MMRVVVTDFKKLRLLERLREISARPAGLSYDYEQDCHDALEALVEYVGDDEVRRLWGEIHAGRD